MASLRIWLITVGEPLPLPGHTERLWRTGLLAHRLAERGHRITWWTSTVDHFTKRHFTARSERREVRRNLELQFLHGVLYTRNISFARWRNHRQIAEEFTRLAADAPSPDLIVCSYPTLELSAAAVRFGRERRVPVLLDVRDLWPDEMAMRLPSPLRPFSRLLFWSMYRDARYALRGADGILAISSKYLRWALGHAGRSQHGQDHVFTHGYPDRQPQPQTLSPAAVAAELGLDPRHRVVWFVGTFVGSIDLGTVIEAARLVQQELPLTFVLTGSGEKEGEWRRQAAGLGNVLFTGWVDQDRLAALASLAWAGLAAYKAGALMSLTNKLFEYMAYGLPILVALPGEARELVEEADCGVFYEPGSPQALCRALRKLCADEAGRDRMARNARRAFEQRYSADAVYGGMTAHLERVAAQRQ